MAQNKDIYLASKPRYEILDGLRGVAALMVLFFHCFETYVPQFGTQHINHGYLAVDFFFVLSGFVIGYAYDDRWEKMRWHLAAAGQSLLSAVYHALSADVCADDLGGESSGCASMASRGAQCRHVHHLHRHRLGSAQAV